jgi:hypothetical protein
MIRSLDDRGVSTNPARIEPITNGLKLVWSRSVNNASKLARTSASEAARAQAVVAATMRRLTSSSSASSIGRYQNILDFM